MFRHIYNLIIAVKYLNYHFENFNFLFTIHIHPRKESMHKTLPLAFLWKVAAIGMSQGSPFGIQDPAASELMELLWPRKEEGCIYAAVTM
jgi:hypothetical protein